MQVVQVCEGRGYLVKGGRPITAGTLRDRLDTDAMNSLGMQQDRIPESPTSGAGSGRFTVTFAGRAAIDQFVIKLQELHEYEAAGLAMQIRDVVFGAGGEGKLVSLSNKIGGPFFANFGSTPYHRDQKSTAQYNADGSLLRAGPTIDSAKLIEAPMVLREHVRTLIPDSHYEISLKVPENPGEHRRAQVVEADPGTAFCMGPRLSGIVPYFQNEGVEQYAVHGVTAHNNRFGDTCLWIIDTYSSVERAAAIMQLIFDPAQEDWGTRGGQPPGQAQQ